MAKIILDPLEVFEHCHNENSFSILLEGEALICIDGKEMDMVIDVPVHTPRLKSHVIRNTGQKDCIIKCGSHGGSGSKKE